MIRPNLGEIALVCDYFIDINRLFSKLKVSMPEYKRALISKDDALVIAKQVFEAMRAGRPDAITLVNAILRERGLRYANNSLDSRTEEYMADEIVHFSTQLLQR